MTADEYRVLLSLENRVTKLETVVIELLRILAEEDNGKKH